MIISGHPLKLPDTSSSMMNRIFCRNNICCLGAVAGLILALIMKYLENNYENTHLHYRTTKRIPIWWGW
jgi:hypothetical protein